MTICNACRYCEGYCAVFPAMEKRTQFGPAELGYLANLCHNCGACLPACQYAPPHEFGVNVPQTLAQIRGRTYRLPAPWKLVLMLPAAIVAMFALMLVYAGTAGLFARHAGRFFDLFPHNLLILVFGIVTLAAAYHLVIRMRSYRAEMKDPAVTVRAIGRALHDAFTLVNLGGGGEGCIVESERPSQIRRTFHHSMFYGFLACFAATVVAALYDNVLGWRAPYPVFSLPVVLGTAGGLAMLLGGGGLLVVRAKRDPALTDAGQRGNDVLFIAMLLLAAVTGLLLLVFRDTGAMGALLAIHLGIVFVLIWTIPYGKFIHAFYRLAALIRFAAEQGD